MTATTRRLGAVARHVGRHASACPHDKDSSAGARRAPLNATPAAHEGAQDLGGLEEQMTVDVLVVGAGFAGMIALRRFRDELGLRVRVLEQGSGVGGTWYWNAYPGAHCDVPVLEYSPGFDAELERDYSSEWTGLFASQPELLRYAEHMKERFDLARSITFDTKVVGCEWDAAAAQWGVRTDTGSSQWRASVVVACIGCLSQPNVPEIAGADSFAGEVYTTSRFPHEGVDFHGKRVAVIGTGSSGIQAIPVIAREAEHLLVFQRTPQYTLPAGQRPISDRLRSRTVENYGAVRAFNRASAGGFGGLAGAVPKKKGLDGTAHNASATAAPPAPPPPPVGILDLSWEERLERLHEAGLACLYTWADVLTDMEANAAACELFAEWLRQSVHDPDTAAKLTPTNQPFGCKRQVIDTGYYITYNRPNVELVDLRRGGIERITPAGLSTAGQGDFEFDVLVYATGFDAMTGPLQGMGVVGVGGATIDAAWEAGPRSYLGLTVAGFPNLFTVTGPGSPSVLSNMTVSIEQHVDFIAEMLTHMRRAGKTTVQATAAAQDEWVEHVNELSRRDVVKTHPSCNSWYLGANIEGKSRVFMPYVAGVGAYRTECEEVVAGGYRGFVFG